MTEDAEKAAASAAVHEAALRLGEAANAASRAGLEVAVEWGAVDVSTLAKREIEYRAAVTVEEVTRRTFET